MNYFDLLVGLILLNAFHIGYKNGLIKTIFRTTGYIVGGVAGLAFAFKYLSDWESQTQKVIFALLAVFFGAKIGELLFGRIGSLFRKALFVLPLKQIDSIFGATVYTLRTALTIYLVGYLLIFSTQGVIEEYISSSRFYKFTESNLPITFSGIKPWLNAELK
jgi:uncharacterized membrane protein required for colicin V production